MRRMVRRTGIPGALLICLIIAVAGRSAYAETYYLDSRNGNDASPGTTAKPLKTLAKAAELVNASKAPGPTTLRVAAGVYNLTEAVVFKNDRPYTREKRLTIEAAVLPDDPGWKPESMPIILSTEVPPDLDKTEEVIETSGLKIELDHVTVRGLKFLGSPVPGIWYYPVFREGKNLDDLLVTQCSFVMDKNSMTSNVAILANGHGLVVDHCVFFGCRNPVVFWRAEGGTSRGNAMRYCIVDGAFTSGVWVCDTAEDFEFHHNVMARSSYAWMRDDDNKRKYTVRDSVITDSEHFSGKCAPEWKLSPTGEEITFKRENVITSGTVILETGNGIDADLPRNWLHVAEGTPGSELGAGLFYNLPGEPTGHTAEAGENPDS